MASRNPKPPQAPQSGDSSKNLFGTLFGTAMAVSKWQSAMSYERQAKLMDMFSIPRDDPDDIYKPNSKLETQITIEQPPNKPMSSTDAELLQEIAANYDYGCQLDIIEASQPKATISSESKIQLERLPTWLRFLILYKYDLLVARYGSHVHNFLKLIANYVDTKRVDLYCENLEEDFQQDGEDLQNEYEIRTKYELAEKDVTQATHRGDIHEKAESSKVAHVKHSFFEHNDLFKLKQAIWRWKLPRTIEQDWAPIAIHRSATTLRRALLTQPTPTEIAMVAEDEKIRENAASIQRTHDEEDNNGGTEMAARKDGGATGSWDDLISDKPAYREEVSQYVEKDLRKIPVGLSKAEREKEEMLIEQRAAVDPAITASSTSSKDRKKKRKFWQKLKDHEVLKKKEQESKTVNLGERATFRRYSRIWEKNCPAEHIKMAKRYPHHYRWDGSFHAYVVALVGSSIFKLFIMLIIILNALVLALETTKDKDDDFVNYMFGVLDNLFLSVYLAEFVLKFYAHPYGYWTSGFNIFDFIILLISLVKAIFDWTGLGNLGFLKFLVIFRALRILRGISLSVQIQVLITALVDTLKTHVLSVLVLLFLLMYIAAIMAFYLFSDIEGLQHPWGNILNGMLRLFSFVTMDGWTDTSQEFEEAGYVNYGRIFCIICILLGNFLISNIFIAIIIMQISEATEAFRSKQRDEREEIISLKKEIVFRRQKLDMRQLLAKQAASNNADFYYLGSQFLQLLRHDDLVDMNNIQFSPLWMDAFYKSVKRCHHTANLIMNLHRQLADSLLEMYRNVKESAYIVNPIRRSRYNRYMKLKSKLAILRQEFYRENPAPFKPKLRVKVPE